MGMGGEQDQYTLLQLAYLHDAGDEIIQLLRAAFRIPVYVTSDSSGICTISSQKIPADSSGLITVVLTDPISPTRTEKVEGEGQTVTQLNVSCAPTQTTLVEKDGTEYTKVQYRYDGFSRLVEKEDVLGRKTVYEDVD